MSSFSQQTKRTDSLSLARDARGTLQMISLPNTIGFKSRHLVSQVSAEMNSGTFIETEDCGFFFCESVRNSVGKLSLLKKFGEKFCHNHKTNNQSW
jgi:hypothetical protein